MPSSPSDIAFRAMLSTDYAAVRALWEQTENIGLNESDNACAITAFLARNVGLSPVAIARDGTIVGALLCGHDGRRGYLHHLAVVRDHRGQGLARQLIDLAIAGLRGAGITKVNLFVFEEGNRARSFWEHQGWRRPDTWHVMQKTITGCGGKDGGTC